MRRHLERSRTLRSRGRDRDANPMWVARAQAAAGESDVAVAWPERAYETRAMELATIRDPVWACEQPRFQAVANEMGLTGGGF